VELTPAGVVGQLTVTYTGQHPPELDELEELLLLEGWYWQARHIDRAGLYWSPVETGILTELAWHWGLSNVVTIP
jgi:hypothetical protein